MADGTPGHPKKPSVNPGKKANSGNPVTRPWRPAVGECRPQVVPPRWERSKNEVRRCQIVIVWVCPVVDAGASNVAGPAEPTGRM